MKKGETVTSCAGYSSGRLNLSPFWLPIVNLPPGTAIMLIEARVPGTVSVKLANDVTVAGSVKTGPVVSTGATVIFSCL